MSPYLAKNKSKLKQNRDEEKANNEEFVSVLNAVFNGETPEVDNSVSHPEVIRNGKNQMGLYAGQCPQNLVVYSLLRCLGIKKPHC